MLRNVAQDFSVCGRYELWLGRTSCSHMLGALMGQHRSYSWGPEVSVPPGSLFCPELVAWKPGDGLISVMAGQSWWLLLLAQALVATSW